MGFIPDGTVWGGGGGGLRPYHRARGDLSARRCVRPGKMGTKQNERRRRRRRQPAANEGRARDTDPLTACAPHMGAHRASAVGRLVKESPIATDTGTPVSLEWQEHPRAGGYESRGRACGSCCRRSGSPRPQACMAGCSSHESREARTQPRITSTGQGRPGAGSERQSNVLRARTGTGRSATRQPSTQRGGHSQRNPPPPPRETTRSLSGSREEAPPLSLPSFPPPPRRARRQFPLHVPPLTDRYRERDCQLTRHCQRKRSPQPKVGGGGQHMGAASHPRTGMGGGRGTRAGQRQVAGPWLRASGRCKPGR